MNLTGEHKGLWQRIIDFEIDDPDSHFSFSSRLARENNWSLEYSLRVINEYKRFIFLICTQEGILTPSDQVDQVWHLHLIYTHSYWDDFCQHTLGKLIHHGPTKGGQEEGKKYINAYEKTLIKYEAVFGAKPPVDIWPATDTRFGEIIFKRINTHRNWIIKKPTFLRKSLF